MTGFEQLQDADVFYENLCQFVFHPIFLTLCTTYPRDVRTGFSKLRE